MGSGWLGDENFSLTIIRPTIADSEGDGLFLSQSDQVGVFSEWDVGIANRNCAKNFLSNQIRQVDNKTFVCCITLKFMNEGEHRRIVAPPERLPDPPDGLEGSTKRI